MKILGEFREFISRGNVVDLAVGVIIGAAFSNIVTALVDKVIMPPIGLATSGVDFANLQWVLKPDNPATKASELVAVQYGALINTLIQFLLVAFVVFLIVKGANEIRRRYEREGPDEPAAPTPTEALLTEIRDLLKARQG
jgi:large conductance mechanosensitive channel